MIRNSKYPLRCREKAVGVSLYRKDAKPILELRAESNSKHRRVLPLQRYGIGFTRTDERGYYPNLGGTTD